MNKRLEQEAIRATINGNTEAFTPIVKYYSLRICSFVNKIVNNQDIAQDITQQTFCNAYTRLNTYKPSYVFSTWLFSIAKHETYNHLKRESRFQDYLTTYDHQNELISVEDQVIRKDDYRHLIDAIDNLPKKYQDVVILKYFNAYTSKEIGQYLGISRRSVDSILYRAKMRLAKDLSTIEGGNKRHE